MDQRLLYCMIVLVLVALVSSVIAPKVQEHFVEADKEVPLKSINLCGRNIVFPYFSRNAFTASQRSLSDYDSVKTNPIGKCRIEKINGIVNESHSIVHENSLFYNLKNSCMAFRTKDLLLSGNVLTVNFLTDTISNMMNVGTMLLLNPLYLEFVIDDATTSVAYRCTTTSIRFSNKSDLKDIVSLSFAPVPKKDNNDCDSTFNYQSLSKDHRELTPNDLVNMMRYDNVLNAKVYYLDTLSSSFQNVGRKLKLVYSDTGAVNIFETDYQKYFQDKYSTNVYEFMNNVALMYTNYVYPVFTFKFSINITKDKNYQTPGAAKNLFAKVFMDTDVGTYEFCKNANDTSAGKNNLNILGLALEGINEESYNLVAFTGNGQYCNLGAENNLSVKVPYLVNNNYINVIVTVTPNERTLLAKWSDIRGGSVSSSFSFGKTTDCGDTKNYYTCVDSRQNPAQTQAVNSSLLGLFTTPNDKRSPLANIRFHYNKNIVKDLDSCMLGYVNLVNELNI